MTRGFVHWGRQGRVLRIANGLGLACSRAQAPIVRIERCWLNRIEVDLQVDAGQPQLGHDDPSCSEGLPNNSDFFPLHVTTSASRAREAAT